MVEGVSELSLEEGVSVSQVEREREKARLGEKNKKQQEPGETEENGGNAWVGPERGSEEGREAQ